MDQLQRYKAIMKTALFSTLLIVFALNVHATTVAGSVSKRHFEKKCMSEVKARKQGRESDNLCSAYLNGFIDGGDF